MFTFLTEGFKAVEEQRYFREEPERRCLQLAPAEEEQTVVFNCLDLYYKPPDSGERQYKLRTRKRRFDPALKAGGVAVE